MVGACCRSSMEPMYGEFWFLVSHPDRVFGSLTTVLVYLRPRFLRERERQRSARRRMQRRTESVTSFNSRSSGSEHFGSREAIGGYFRAVSSAVQEGCLSDEEDVSDTEPDPSEQSPASVERPKDTGVMETHRIDDIYHSAALQEVCLSDEEDVSDTEPDPSEQSPASVERPKDTGVTETHRMDDIDHSAVLNGESGSSSSSS